MKRLWFLIFFVLCLGTVAPVFAGENALGLDDSNHYDIYISSYSGGGLSVLKDVEIIAVKNILDRKFLLIRTDFFNSKKTEGLVGFDNIHAILPTDRSRPIQAVSDQNLQYLMK